VHLQLVAVRFDKLAERFPIALPCTCQQFGGHHLAILASPSSCRTRS
jgi:hypothetical protein